MIIVDLDEMKKYLRLEPEDTMEDDLIWSLIDTAEEYVRDATGFKFTILVPEKAKLIVKLLVSHWYENRAIETSQLVNKIGFTVNTLLNQLTYAYSVEDIDGTTIV